MTTIYGRSSAIFALKCIVSHFNLASDIRDLAVQIFDKYYHLNKCFKDFYEVQTIIASCVLIASKALDSNSLKSQHFKGLVSACDLQILECQILNSIGFHIDPCNTPSFISRTILNNWKTDLDRTRLLSTVDGLLGKFLDIEESARFSPVVVAIVTVLLAIGRGVSMTSEPHIFIDVLSFTRSLFSTSAHLDQESYSYLPLHLSYVQYSDADLDRCLKVYQNLTPSRPQFANESPVSVATRMNSNYESIQSAPTVEADGLVENINKKRRITHLPSV